MIEYWALSFAFSLLIGAATVWAMFAINRKSQRDLKRDREEDARLIKQMEQEQRDLRNDRLAQEMKRRDA